MTRLLKHNDAPIRHGDTSHKDIKKRSTAVLQSLLTLNLILWKTHCKIKNIILICNKIHPKTSLLQHYLTKIALYVTNPEAQSINLTKRCTADSAILLSTKPFLFRFRLLRFRRGIILFLPVWNISDATYRHHCMEDAANHIHHPDCMDIALRRLLNIIAVR